MSVLSVLISTLEGGRYDLPRTHCFSAVRVGGGGERVGDLRKISLCISLGTTVQSFLCVCL
jgi:hypothetical protein